MLLIGRVTARATRAASRMHTAQRISTTRKVTTASLSACSRIDAKGWARPKMSCVSSDEKVIYRAMKAATTGAFAYGPALASIST